VSTYSQIAWLPLTGGLTLIGLLASWLAWRRRGAGAGLRGVAWSLLPLAAYLIGVIELLWRFGVAIGSFATSFVFSLKVWAGVAVLALAVVAFVVSGGLRRRRARKGVTGKPATGKALARPAGADGKASPALPASKGRAAASKDDDDLGDVAEILKRRGIR
jgi:hypothetical protein